MRIAVISHEAQTLLNFRGPLLAEMVRRGHTVLAFAPNHNAVSRAALAGLGVETVDYSVSRSGTNPLRELGSIFELRRLLRQQRVELSFAYSIKPVIYGTIAAWLAGVPRRYGLIEGLGFAFTEGNGQSWTRRMLRTVITTLTRFAGRRIHRMVFLNRDDQKEFLDRGLIGKEKTRLMGAIGLDLSDWPTAPFPEGPVTFILVARMLRDKGIVEYVEAARILKRSLPETRFLLVGGLDKNPAALRREELAAWVAEGIVEWPGHVEVRPWIAAAHVFVLPSYYREGVPRSTQEAMAMGRPVVTTDMPGCRETVVDGVNGYLVPARDVPALSEAMRRFIEAPSRINLMGRESRQKAERDFDVHRQNDRLLTCMDIETPESITRARKSDVSDQDAETLHRAS